MRVVSDRHSFWHGKLHRPGLVNIRAFITAAIASCLCACGGSAPQPSTTPTPDSVTRNYVELVHSYWIGIMTADGVTGSSNAAAMSCLGSKQPSDGPDADLVDPPMCREHAMALLMVQQKFQHDLDNTPAPARFAADDRAIRSALP